MSKYLIDTQVIIWVSEDNKKISEKARQIILNQDSELFFSTISIWEMAIKISIDKLKIPHALKKLIDLQITQNDIQELNLIKEHTYKMIKLPYHHNDPFDRLLIAQAIYENLSIISSDEKFDSYDVERVW